MKYVYIVGWKNSKHPKANKCFFGVYSDKEEADKMAEMLHLGFVEKHEIKRPLLSRKQRKELEALIKDALPLG